MYIVEKNLFKKRRTETMAFIKHSMKRTKQCSSQEKSANSAGGKQSKIFASLPCKLSVTAPLEEALLKL